ncbi:MAG: pilin [Minisyncoccota bacterium]
MKKISRFAILLVFFASFSIVPLSASADAGCGALSSAGDQCILSGVSGTCTGANGTCVPNQNSASASSGGGININAIKPYSDSIINIINGIFVPVLFALAFLTFIWGVFKYFILGADSDAERATGRKFVLWGIIGFVVILSVWGLVGLLGNTLGLSPGGSAPSYPTL